MSGDHCCNAHSGHESQPRRTLTRRGALVGGLALGAIPFLPRAAGAAPTIGDRDFGFDPPRPPGEVHRRPIMYPVLPDPTLGKATWTDTYLAPRGGGRRHEGQDLMGKKMLKLLACVNGTIVELRHRASGNSLYLKGDDGWYYCYLHVNNDRPGTDDGSNLFEHAFAPGMVQGKRVKQGDHIAYLGDSGNAENSGSHLHFEIRMPNASLWKAAAVNAKYALDAAKPAKLNGTTPNAYAPFTGALAFTEQQANDFFGGIPDWDWLVAAVNSVDKQGKNVDQFIAEMVDHPMVTQVVNPIIRMQLACFGAPPSWNRVDVLTRLVRAGVTLEAAAEHTINEAKLTPDHIDDTDFLIHMHQTMKVTSFSPNRVHQQTKQLSNGVTRGQMLRLHTEERTYRIATAAEVRSSTVWMSMLRRTMPAVHHERWSVRDRNEPTGLRSLAATLRASAEYRARFA